MQKQKGPARRSLGEGGFTLLELLIVLTIIAIIAAIAIPSYWRAEFTRTVGPFKAHFGVNLSPYAKRGTPTQQWLDDEQKALIRPLVNQRLAELCTPSGQQTPPVLSLPPATDPSLVELRLERLAGERATIAQQANADYCTAARKVAADFGILPVEEP